MRFSFSGNVRVELRASVVRRIEGAEYGYINPGEAVEALVEDSSTEGGCGHSRAREVDFVAEELEEEAPVEDAEKAVPESEVIEEHPVEEYEEYDEDELYNGEVFRERSPTVEFFLRLGFQLIAFAVILRRSFHFFGFPILWKNLLIVASINAVFY